VGGAGAGRARVSKVVNGYADLLLIRVPTL